MHTHTCTPVVPVPSHTPKESRTPLAQQKPPASSTPFWQHSLDADITALPDSGDSRGAWMGGREESGGGGHQSVTSRKGDDVVSLHVAPVATSAAAHLRGPSQTPHAFTRPEAQQVPLRMMRGRDSVHSRPSSSGSVRVKLTALLTHGHTFSRPHKHTHAHSVAWCTGTTRTSEGARGGKDRGTAAADNTGGGSPAHWAQEKTVAFPLLPPPRPSAHAQAANIA